MHIHKRKYHTHKAYQTNHISILLFSPQNYGYLISFFFFLAFFGGRGVAQSYRCTGTTRAKAHDARMIRRLRNQTRDLPQVRFQLDSPLGRPFFQNSLHSSKTYFSYTACKLSRCQNMLQFSWCQLKGNSHCIHHNMYEVMKVNRARNPSTSYSSL